MSTAPLSQAGYYADFGGLESLKKSARQDENSAVRSAARQFESLFTSMLLKSMREASMGEGLGDSEATQFYQQMFDQQLSVQMSQGKGLGLADMLVQQLTRTGLVRPGQSSQSGPAIGTGPAAAAPIGNGSAIDAPQAPTMGSGAGAEHGPAMGVGPRGDAISMGSSAPPTAANFVQQLAPAAQQLAQRLGVAPESIIAQAALETGWGQHTPTDASGAASNNLFGIKASGNWDGAAVQAMTTEFSGGQSGRMQQAFRAYDSPTQSLEDYGDLLQRNSRYAAALGTGSDVGAFATALQNAGYATDPDYARKLTAVAQSVRVMLGAAPLKSDTPLPTQSQNESV
ncbi:MAG: flagellar assembly peptidoglycan hydrolase FlgJ [Steroidobacteraceae bacterium]